MSGTGGDADGRQFGRRLVLGNQSGALLFLVR